MEDPIVQQESLTAPEQSSAVQPAAPPETSARDWAAVMPAQQIPQVGQYPIAVVQMPSLCRMVHYILTQADCEKIIAARKAAGPWQEGNEPRPGTHVAMVIVAVWGPSCVNGHVLLDGNDGLWVTSRNYSVADESLGVGDPSPGTWHWPEREQ